MGQAVLLSGRYDKVTPTYVETVYQELLGQNGCFLIRDMPHLEETARLMQGLNELLSRIKVSAGS